MMDWACVSILISLELPQQVQGNLHTVRLHVRFQSLLVWNYLNKWLGHSHYVALTDVSILISLELPQQAVNELEFILIEGSFNPY